MKKLYNKKFWKTILIIYSLMLFIFVILKLQNNTLEPLRSAILKNRAKGYWNYNIVLFHTIKTYLDFTHLINLINIFGNIIPFILLGFLFSISQNKFGISKVFLQCLSLILSFEIIQFVTCLGFFDVDDILLNSISCFLGILLYLVIQALWNIID